MIKKFELSKKDWVYKSVPQGEAKLGYKELPLSKNQDFWKNEIDYSALSRKIERESVPPPTFLRQLSDGAL